MTNGGRELPAPWLMVRVFQCVCVCVCVCVYVSACVFVWVCLLMVRVF